MALVLDHFRNIPQDVLFTEGRIQFDLVVRASNRVDEVVQIISWLSKANTGFGQHATRDALSTLKMALAILSEAWDDMSADERQNSLEMARLSLVRFCSLSRPRRAVSPV